MIYSANIQLIFSYFYIVDYLRVCKIQLLEHHILCVTRCVLISALLAVLSDFFFVEQYSLYDNRKSFLFYGLSIGNIYGDISPLQLFAKVVSSLSSPIILFLLCLVIILWNLCRGLVLNSIFSIKILDNLEMSWLGGRVFLERWLQLYVIFL